MVDEMERSVHDALCVVKRVLESNQVVPGGGAVEAALSIYLENFATSIVSAPLMSCLNQTIVDCFLQMSTMRLSVKLNFSLLLLFDCGGVSVSRPVIKNHAPLWKQPLLWLNVDYHSINYEAYYTSHIACQPHSYLNPNQTIVLTTLVCSMYTFLSVTLPLPPPPTDIQRTVGHCRVCQYSVGDPQDIGCKRCPGLHRPRGQTESFPQRVSNYGREREPQVVSK